MFGSASEPAARNREAHASLPTLGRSKSTARTVNVSATGAEGLASLDQALFNFDSPALHKVGTRFQDGQDPDSGVVNHTAPFRIPYAGGGPAWSGVRCFPVELVSPLWRPPNSRGALPVNPQVVGLFGQPHGRPPAQALRTAPDGHLAIPGRPGFAARNTTRCPVVVTGQLRENRLFNDCHHYLQVSLASRIADILDQPDDAERYRAECAAIKRAIQQEYFDASQGRFSQESNSSRTWLCRSCWTLCRMKIVRRCCRQPGRRHSGDAKRPPRFRRLGGALYTRRLVRERRSDLIYKMATRTTWPGWGDMPEQGRHDTLGALAAGRLEHPQLVPLNRLLVLQRTAGIRPDPEAAGFKRVLIEPQMAPGIRWVRASYDSIHGPLAVEWKAEDARLSIDVSISPNATARVALPASIEAESGRALAQSPGVTLVRTEPGRTVVDIQSGKYRFTSR